MSKFYNEIKMKKIIQISFVLIALISFNKNVYACDAINVPIGSKVSDAETTLDFIDNDVENSDEDSSPVQFQANTIDYCPNSNLDNTKLYVVVFNSMIAGIRVETLDPKVEKNQIYEFVKHNYGSIDSEPTKKNWTGYKEINQPGRLILYGKYKMDNEIYETLDISTEELIDYMSGEDLIESNI
mgnify:CR=1 FL=1